MTTLAVVALPAIFQVPDGKSTSQPTLAATVLRQLTCPAGPCGPVAPFGPVGPCALPSPVDPWGPALRWPRCHLGVLGDLALHWPLEVPVDPVVPVFRTTVLSPCP
jgi:hypothetical protein